MASIKATEEPDKNVGQGQFAYISRDGGKIVYTRRDMDAGVVGIVFAQGTIRDSKHSMGLRLNKESFQPGDILDLSIDLRAGDTDSVVDAYLALLLPSGIPFFWRPDRQSFSRQIEPVCSACTVADYSGVIITIPLDASILPGPYTFYAVLTKQGSDPLVQDNWLSNLAQASL